MQKISANKVVAVLAEIPDTLRKLASERDFFQTEYQRLKEENNKFKLAGRIEKIAQQIHDKGIGQGRNIEETKQFLFKKAAEGNLEVVAQAIEMTAPSNPLGVLGDKPISNSGGEFENYLLS